MRAMRLPLGSGAAFPIALLVALLIARIGAAQCGAKRSTCSACHDGVRAQAASHEAWHEDHAFADLCPVCHGGHGEEADDAASHVGLVAPLGDAEVQCAPCHGANTQSFFSRYRTRARTPDAGGVAPPDVGPADSGPPPSMSSYTGRNVAMTFVVIIVGAAAATYVLHQEHVRAARRATDSSS